MNTPLQVRSHTEDSRTVIELSGKLTGALPAEARERALALVKPGCHLVLDLTGLSDVSGIGLRMLLLFCRRVQAVAGTITGVGISPKLRDLAEAAGFARLFQLGAQTVKLLVPPPAVSWRIDAYPTHELAGFGVRAGFPIPFGATPVLRGINFSVYSRHAVGCTLALFEPEQREPFAEIPFLTEFRIGDVFAMTVFDLEVENLEYGYRMDGPFMPEQGHRFDRTRVLLDPMTRSVSGRETWGSGPDPSHPYPYRGRLVPEDFDWEDDHPLGLPIEELVIYEMHVRGFTRSPSSGVKHPGTFAGLREMIPYLKELGVNCVELLPIFEFEELENQRKNPLTGERLWNYWGYNTVAFFAPNSSYAATGSAGLQADEFKALVKELHRHEIEVILDVVCNHTAEGDENGPIISFRGLDNRTYYMLTPDGRYFNFSGCGNTFNCNNPAVRSFVIDCLRYWVYEYHVDGFRFDLASILGRDPSGAPLNNPPLLESLAGDPVLGRTKLIAEAWDAGGLYQVGTFPAYGRWAEWNGKFRDDVRKFLKGDHGLVGAMANRLVGSPDLYYGRGASASINFVTCHDGFTLADLVSYIDKHNEANGEDNKDGANDNHSWNCGAEGPTDNPAIQALRLRQMKNALTMLLVSQGVPMLLMGDECGHSQQGNNNAYCHDSPLTWLDWSLREKNAELFRFCRLLIQFRRRHPVLRHPLHPGPGAPQVIWHGTRPGCPDWSPGSRVLAFQRQGAVSDGADVVYVALNMHGDYLEFELPAPPSGRRWHVFANTGMPAPEDIWEPGQEPPLGEPGNVGLGGRSIMVLVAR